MANQLVPKQKPKYKLAGIQSMKAAFGKDQEDQEDLLEEEEPEEGESNSALTRKVLKFLSGKGAPS